MDSNPPAMSFFDFFFPKQAQAIHLRDLVHDQRLSLHRQRIAEIQRHRAEASQTRAFEERIEELERDVGQAGLVIEALLELLEEKNGLDRETILNRVNEIDARDGQQDGKLSPPPPPPKVPFTPKRKWNGPREG